MVRSLGDVVPLTHVILYTLTVELAGRRCAVVAVYAGDIKLITVTSKTKDAVNFNALCNIDKNVIHSMCFAHI